VANVQVIAPEEMVKAWQQALPDEVVETFNEMLMKQFNGKTASIPEQVLLFELEKKNVSSRTVLEQRWLTQTMELYKERGWKVVYKDYGGSDEYVMCFDFSLA
jgi:hypothetical protein